jgi:NAD(P)-dependent dehydrogenase (short-subunit alcohol dehydrogenase family)
MAADCKSESELENTTAMEGKTVLITGANSGIGKAAARALAKMGARVVISGRDRPALETALADIRSASGNNRVEMLVADLSSQKEVRRLAAEFKQTFGRLDVLLNNAGVILSRRTVTVDGLETTFAVNHLAPFLLTAFLRDALVASAPARVVTVASEAHRQTAGLDFDDLQHEHRYFANSVYSQSKLANILFTRALARRLAGTGVTANCLHPGVVATGWGAGGDVTGPFDWAMRLARPFMMSPEKGARTSVYLASSPDVADVTGQYFAKCKPKQTSPAGCDDDAAERLWAVSAKLVNSEQ